MREIQLMKKIQKLEAANIISMNVIHDYQDAFIWLEKQEWYMNNRHLVTQRQNSIVTVDKSPKEEQK
jgi:hypothetical protein